MLDSGHRTLFVIVIVLPFLAQGVPFPGGVPLFLPFAILLLPATVLLRISRKGTPSLLVGDSLFMAICGVTLLTYVYGIVLSTEFPGGIVLREAANGIIAMVVVFTVANSDWTKSDCDRLVGALAWAILAVGVFVGALGAWKLWLFVSEGQVLEFVVAASSKDYPWGTSLHSDYNFYALTILAAILSAMFLSTGRRPIVQCILTLLIIGLLVVGFLAGSRRFWFVAPVFIALQSVWTISRNGIRPNLPLFGTLLFLVIGLPLALLFSGDESASRMVTSSWDAVQATWNLQHRLMTILDSSGGFGMGARFEIWGFAIERLEGGVPWTGSGFDYMSRFSCEFGDCSGGGYPHMPILSAYLYGGLIAGIVAAAFYIYTTIAGFRLQAYESAVAWLLFPLMAAFLFAAISGNGPFSIRSHVILGALCVAFLRVMKADRESPCRHHRIDDR